MSTLNSLSLLLLTFLLAGTMASASIITVTTNADSGSGSLRAAIASAASGDSITFTNTLSGATITLGSVLTVSNSLSIIASGPASGIKVSGNNSNQVFLVNEATRMLCSLCSRSSMAPTAAAAAGLTMKAAA